MEHRRMLGFELRGLNNLIKSVVCRYKQEEDGAPLTQFQAGIMGYLFHHQDQPVYQKNIEEEFKVSGATASNTLQVMEKNGFIKRSSVDTDGRLKRITMTETACRRHSMVEEHMQEMDRRMLQGMSEQEQEELFRLLRIIRANLEELDRETEARKAAMASAKAPCPDKKEERTC